MRTKTSTRPPTAPKQKADDEFRDAIVVGRFVGTLGLRGELKVAGTRLANDSLEAGIELVLTRGESREVVRIATVRRNAGKLVATLEGAPDRTSAERFVGWDIALPRSAIQLAPSEYLDADLIGSRLVDESGNVLGTVAGVAHYPAQDCLVLVGSGALVPLVQAFVRSVDSVTKTIVVDLPLGLLDASQAEEA